MRTDRGALLFACVAVVVLALLWMRSSVHGSDALDVEACVAHHWQVWEDARGSVPPVEVEDQFRADCARIRRTR